MIVLKRLTSPQPTTSRCYELAGTLSGTLDGSNQTFYTEFDYTPGTLTVFYNGQALYSPDDFTEISNNGLTFNYITPGMYGEDEVVLRASYELFDCATSSVSNKKGINSIPAGQSQASVTFSEAFSNTNYVITTNLVNTVDSTPSVYPYIIGNKTPGSFTVYFQNAVDSNNYKLEWIVIAL